jgi:hypothetical protein
MMGGDFGNHVQARTVGQAHVRQAEVVRALRQLRAGHGNGGGGVGAQAHATQGQHQQFADIVFVIDDQRAGGGTTGFTHTDTVPR